MTKSFITYYRLIYRWNFDVCQSIDNSVGITDTSLYEFSCLNPIVIPLVTTSLNTYT
jgi:hypothetical protein